MKQIILLLITLFCAAFCNARNLPGSWQTNMTLVVYNGPGMFPGWSRTVISDTACYSEGYDGRKTFHLRYKFSTQQLNALLDTLRKNHFNSIKSESVPGITYDKPERSIVLSWAGHTIYVGENASTNIAPQYADALSNIREYIYSLTGN